MTIVMLVSAAVALAAAFGVGCYAGYRFGSKAAAVVSSVVDQIGEK